jgi:hypothetical protein
MIGGSQDHTDKYLGIAWRTVRRPRADRPRGRCYSSSQYLCTRTLMCMYVTFHFRCVPTNSNVDVLDISFLFCSLSIVTTENKFTVLKYLLTWTFAEIRPWSCSKGRASKNGCRNRP